METPEEMAELGHEAVAAFFDRFGPLDETSVVFLEVLFEVLLGEQHLA